MWKNYFWWMEFVLFFCSHSKHFCFHIDYSVNEPNLSFISKYLNGRIHK